MPTYRYSPTGEVYEGFRWQGDPAVLPDWTTERPANLPPDRPFAFAVDGDVLRVPTAGGFDPASVGDHVLRRGLADFQVLRDDVVHECFAFEDAPGMRGIAVEGRGYVMEEGPGGHVGVHSAEHLPADEPPWLKARRMRPTSIHNP